MVEMETRSLRDNSLASKRGRRTSTGDQSSEIIDWFYQVNRFEPGENSREIDGKEEEFRGTPLEDSSANIKRGVMNDIFIYDMESKSMGSVP
jgi:hypothetical protein